MKKKRFVHFVCILFAIILITNCGPGQLLGPTFTPTPTVTNTATPTLTSTPTITPSSTPTFTPTPASISAENAKDLVLLKTISKTSEAGPFNYNEVIFSPDFKTYATTRNNETLILWNTLDDQQISTISINKAIRDVAFSPDSKIIAISSPQITLWDASSGKQISTDNDCLGDFFVFSPDGKTIFNGRSLCDLMTGRELQRFDCSLTCYNLAFSQDGKLVAATEDVGREIGKHEVIIWDAVTGKRSIVLDANIYPPRIDHFPVLAIAFSPNGKLIASIDSKNAIIIWDIATGKKVSVFDTISQKTGLSSLEMSDNRLHLRSIAFSPNSEMLAAGYAGGSIIIWNVATAEPVFVSKSKITSNMIPYANEITAAIAFSPDGTTLAATNIKNTAYVWGLGDLPIQTPLPTQTPSIVLIDVSGSYPFTDAPPRAYKADQYHISATIGTYMIHLDTNDNSNICHLVWQVRASSADPNSPTDIYGDSNIVETFTISQSGDYVISIGRARNTNQCQPFTYTLQVSQP